MSIDCAFHQHHTGYRKYCKLNGEKNRTRESDVMGTGRCERRSGSGHELSIHCRSISNQVQGAFMVHVQQMLVVLVVLTAPPSYNGC